jgi:hypothetical protein
MQTHFLVVPILTIIRYINAEVSGGGFPGWLQRNPAHLRTNETGFLEATYKYVYESQFWRIVFNFIVATSMRLAKS